MAPSSSNSRMPSRIYLESGDSTNGKAAISPNPNDVICNITEAKFVRNISGSVNSGLDRKSCSS